MFEKRGVQRRERREWEKSKEEKHFTIARYLESAAPRSSLKSESAGKGKSIAEHFGAQK